MKSKIILILVLLTFTIFVPFKVVYGVKLDSADYFGSSSQRSAFYTQGRFWQFYTDSYSLKYKTSVDGISWTSATTIDGSYFVAINFDGTYVHIARNYNNELYYRRGNPQSDGSISWSASDQFVTTVTNLNYPSVAVDSSGYPFISFSVESQYTNLTKSNTNDGTWSTESGFPKQVSSSIHGQTLILSLLSGKMYVVYQETASANVYGKLWNGSSLSSEEQINSSGGGTVGSGEFSAVANGDTIHFVYRAVTVGAGTRYRSRNATAWGADSLIDSATSYFPAVAKNGSNLYVILRTTTVFGVKAFLDGAWETAVGWFTHNQTLLGATTVFYEVTGGKLGVSYVDSDYGLYFKELRRITVTDVATDDDRRNMGTEAKVNVTMVSEYTNSPFTTGEFNINEINMTHLGSGIWQATFTVNAIVQVDFDDVNGYDDEIVNMDGNSASVIWDKLDVVVSTASTIARLGNSATIIWTIERLYDSSSVSSFSIDLTLNGNPWQSSLTSSSVSTVEYSEMSASYNVSAVTDNTYDLTVFQVTPAYLIWSSEGSIGPGPVPTSQIAPPEEEIPMVITPESPLPRLGFLGLIIAVGMIAVGGVIVAAPKSSSRRRREAPREKSASRRQMIREKPRSRRYNRKWD